MSRATVLLACLGCAPVVEPQVDHPPASAGPWGVGHTTALAVDSSRDDRPLPLEIWYPVQPDVTVGAEATAYALGGGIGLPSALAVEGEAIADGPFPLLVFSHGYGGIATQSVELTEILASHGFVVVSPEHTGNSQATPDDAFEVAAAHRVPDVSFVMDWVQADPEALFAAQVRIDRAGVIGHSFGGMTALGVAGGWAGADPDPRVRAIVPISAVVDGDLQSDERPHPYAGFTGAQLASIEVPSLLVGGTLDVDVPVENNDLAFEGLTNAPAVHQLDVIGATHTSFANVCQIGDHLIALGITQEAWAVLGAEALLEPYAQSCGDEALAVAEVHRLLHTYAVSFLRVTLQGDDDYADFLSAGFARGEASVVYRRRPRR